MILIDSILKNNRNLFSMHLDINNIEQLIEKEVVNILKDFPFIFELDKYLLKLKKNISNNFLNLKKSFFINDYLFSLDDFFINEKINFRCKKNNSSEEVNFLVYNGYENIYYYSLVDNVCTSRFFIDKNGFINVEYIRNNDFQFLKSHESYIFQISDDFYCKFYNTIEFNSNGEIKSIVLSDYFLSSFPLYPFIKINCFRDKGSFKNINYSLLSRDKKNNSNIKDYEKLQNFGVDIFDIFNFNDTTHKILAMNTVL